MGSLTTGVAGLDTALGTVITIVAGIVFFMGLFKVVMGVKAFSDGMEEMDNARKSQGLNTLIAGLIMCCVTGVVAALGLSLAL